MRNRPAFTFTLICIIFCSGSINRAVADWHPQTEQTRVPALSHDDAVLITETYHLWQTLGDKLWTGWTAVPAPIIYVTTDYEYAVNFRKPLSGFTPLPVNQWLDKPIQARKRVFGMQTAASFPFEGVATVVIGTPKALEKSPAEWALTTSHELFHILQYARGSVQKISKSEIGSETDPSWQLQFPFPYEDPDVMRLIHLQGYPIYLAATATDEGAIKYNAGTAIDAIKVYRSFLRREASQKKSYSYSQFQEWTEGIAFYTEYKMAEAAARDDYQPIEAFKKLPDYQSYQRAWEHDYKNRIFLVKHAGRAAQDRTAFYHLGLGKGLLLDRLLPDWKTRYFAPSIWLDDLIMLALNQPNDVAALTIGSISPDFTATTATARVLPLNSYRAKVVVFDFSQT